MRTLSRFHWDRALTRHRAGTSGAVLLRPGWAFDDSGVPTVSNPASGVTEWEGWAVANRSWWSSIAGDQNRSQFTLGTGAVAIADPDEWDDRGSPSPSSIGPYTALMHTPSVSLAGVAADSLQLAFDSSWRFESPAAGPADGVVRWRPAGDAVLLGFGARPQLQTRRYE